MKLLVVTNAPTLKKGDDYYAYGPYVNEMNLWMKYAQTTIVSPTSYNKPLLITSFKKKPSVVSIPSIEFVSFSESLKSVLKMPYIFLKLFFQMSKNNHIHLRCPGNIGLLASFVQIFFPKKIKTVKYAGNWDPKSKQPLSYKIQKWILSNTFLTKKCKVLVYGEWKNQSKNIYPFFTASYKESEIEKISNKDLTGIIKFMYVGAFSIGKQPMLSVKTIHNLISEKYNVQLHMYGDGIEFKNVEKYVKDNSLEKYIFLHGNKSKNVVKKAFKEAHFLIFISKSEGWPKVVAEAMFWKCLPISSNVSCIGYMLGNGDRGSVVPSNITDKELIKIIKNYIRDDKTYQLKISKAQAWSHKFTLDKFEKEIKKIILNE